MQAIPNIISLMRAPLALLFLKQDIMVRTCAIILAMVSDGLDGYLARKYNYASRSGTLIDPLMDRFFVLFAMGVLMMESRLEPVQATMLLCRDFSVILFGFYLVFTNKLTSYRFRAIWCGKATTFLQFLVLVTLTLGYTIPTIYYSAFLFLGALALVELYLSKSDNPAEI